MLTDRLAATEAQCALLQRDSLASDLAASKLAVAQAEWRALQLQVPNASTELTINLAAAVRHCH